MNCKQGKILRKTLNEMGHQQPATPVHCDNTTAVGIENNVGNKQSKRSKEM